MRGNSSERKVIIVNDDDSENSSSLIESTHLERIPKVDIFGLLQPQWYHRHNGLFAERKYRSMYHMYMRYA